MTSVESELEYVQLGNILFSSALAFLYYDHLLTLDAESRLIWKRSRNSSRYLFLFNRYFAFFGNIVAAVSLYSSSLSSSLSFAGYISSDFHDNHASLNKRYTHSSSLRIIWLSKVISWVFSGSVAARNIDHHWHNHCLSFISLEYNLYLPRLSNCATKLEPRCCYCTRMGGYTPS
ncbi:hypothetical protein FB446DRAFT_280586 [Lentinula raphanica]|nr:hypothetical protein FB446DRAFT_280586 [Lentinula raphanica]